MNWWQRLRARRALESQLQKELRFHVDQHTNDLVTGGLDPVEARRQAELALGGRALVEERCRDARGTRWVDDFVQDARLAARQLLKHPAFAITAIVTLALGIGATTVMFTVVSGVLLKPLPYPESERLTIIGTHTDKYGSRWGVSYPNFVDIERQAQSLTTAAWSYGGGTLSRGDDSEYVNGREISSKLFSVFRVAPVAGRSFLAEEDRPGGAPVVIISDDLWQRMYNRNRAAIDSPVVLDGTPYTIVGVAPAGLRLDGDASVFTPLGQDSTPRMRNRQANFAHVVARIRDEATSAEARAELATISRRLESAYPDANTGASFFERSLLQESVGDVQAMLWLLLAAVSLVVLIACVNVANLLLARAVSREREFAMRASLGASRGRLMRQCLTESGLLGLLGGALGVGLAAITVRPFVLLWPGNLPRAQEIDLDWRVLAFALGVSLASGFLFGIAPALRAPSRALEQTLRRGARGAGGAARLHSGFVISEIALAVILLVAAGMLGRTMLRLSSVDPGIDIKNVLTSRVALAPSALQSPAQMRAAWQEVLRHANSTPGVRAAALSDIIPMRVGLNGLGYWTSPTPPPANQVPIALASCVTPEYLSVMRLPLRAGRFLDDHDRLDTEPVVVIDEVLAQHAFPQQNAVGQHLWIQALGKESVRVVGVVGHVRHWGLASDDGAQMRDQIYYPLSQVPDRLMRLFSSVMSMAVRTDVPPANVSEPLRRNLRTASGAHVLYQTRTMEDLAGGSLARQRFLMTLLGISAGVALLLACIGIYGVLSYLTSQRIPEFGVRMALGATASDVMRLVVRQSLGMLVTGTLVGMAGALGAARLLQASVDGVQRMELSTVACMTAVLMVSGWIATLVPARRAARVDAVEALREA